MDEREDRGFTLVEVLVVMSIVVILAVIVTSGINPIAQVNRGGDAKMKSDIGRIKIAMEDYYNDKGCYPNQVLIDVLNDSSSCGKGVFAPWLASWPCDPHKAPYRLAIETGICPKWFKVFAKLDSKDDKDIPTDWDLALKYVGSANPDNTYTNDQVNYGMSSTNTKWNERLMIGCGTVACFQKNGGGWDSGNCTAGYPNCAWGSIGMYHEQCWVGCCIDGVVCD